MLRVASLDLFQQWQHYSCLTEALANTVDAALGVFEVGRPCCVVYASRWHALTMHHESGPHLIACTIARCEWLHSIPFIRARERGEASWTRKGTIFTWPDDGPGQARSLPEAPLCVGNPGWVCIKW